MRNPRHRSFEIYASQESIDNSERNSLHWCIFALAIIYSIRGSQHVVVDKSETRFSYRGFRYIFPTPLKTANIAKNYDSGRLMKTDIRPWRDRLENVISIEPIQHKRPSAKNRKSVSKKTKKCSRVKTTRWNGGRVS